MGDNMLEYLRKIKVVFNERLNFLEKVCFPLFLRDISPFEMESNYFLFNLSLIFISCEERTVITHKNVLMTRKWFHD